MKVEGSSRTLSASGEVRVLGVGTSLLLCLHPQQRRRVAAALLRRKSVHQSVLSHLVRLTADNKSHEPIRVLPEKVHQRLSPERTRAAAHSLRNLEPSQ